MVFSVLATPVIASDAAVRPVFDGEWDLVMLRGLDERMADYAIKGLWDPSGPVVMDQGMLLDTVSWTATTEGSDRLKVSRRGDMLEITVGCGTPWVRLMVSGDEPGALRLDDGRIASNRTCERVVPTVNGDAVVLITPSLVADQLSNTLVKAKRMTAIRGGRSAFLADDSNTVLAVLERPAAP